MLREFTEKTYLEPVTVSPPDLGKRRTVWFPTSTPTHVPPARHPRDIACARLRLSIKVHDRSIAILEFFSDFRPSPIPSHDTLLTIGDQVGRCRACRPAGLPSGEALETAYQDAKPIPELQKPRKLTPAVAASHHA